MEAGAGAAAGRGGSMPMPSQIARKQWRAVSEQSIQNPGNEERERTKLSQSDERTIYEVQHGTGPLDVDFCSITIDNNMSNDPLQQRLHGISRQREELQQMEIDLRAQIIARSEILEMQNSFDAQIKDHISTVAKLKEQLQEREHCIQELEIKMEEKERELRAIKVNNEAVWAKEDLLREQNKELATFRIERDNSEAERAQHLAELHDLKEHIQEKERQFLEMEEKHRVAQEAILYKDEQLREAQAWISRVQEMDVLQSTTLQAELRERIEHFNQLWLGCQRQFADMERHHLQAIQQLQLELAEAREHSGVYGDNARISRVNPKDSSLHAQNKGTEFNVNEAGSLNGNSGILPNGSMDSASSFVPVCNAPTKIDHASGVPVVPPSILGMGPFLPTGQVTAVHPFVMHQHGLSHSVPPSNPQITQSHVEHFQPIPAIASHQHWQNQQAMADSSQLHNHNQYQTSQSGHGHLRSESHFDCEPSTDRQVLHSEYMEAHISPRQRSSEEQVLESNDKQYIVPQEPQNIDEETLPQFHGTLSLDPNEQVRPKVNPDNNAVQQVNKPGDLDSADLSHSVAVTDQAEGKQGLTIKQPWSSAMIPTTPVQPINSSGDVLECNARGAILTEGSVMVEPKSGLTPHGKTVEPAFLDERSLLACLVRAIPAGSNGRIRISSTLPNRLGKMLAPLHWHDYKKKYGKLDEFVASHPELFVMEGDFIHLREGAQAIISAAAVAKAAAASPSRSALLIPAVAVTVTPTAQIHRMKKLPSADPKSATASNPGEVSVAAPKQESNGVNFKLLHGSGYQSVKILSKSKEHHHQEQNGLLMEDAARGAANSSVNIMMENNGTKATLQKKGQSYGGRNGTAKQQQGRA